MVNPAGCSRNWHRVASRAWARGSLRRSPATRVPVSVVTGWQVAVIAVAPSVGSWLMVWTRSRRRLAVKPICRRAGRLCSRLPMAKSRVSLMVVSVRSARPSSWYCLILLVL